jgi:hypothetical protein
MPRTVAVVALALAALPAQDGLRIVQVPEQVRLPAAGTNLLLEVEAATDPTAVWLAVDGAAQDRVPLTAVGSRRFQLNLAAPAVADLLPAGRDHGELFVFARGATGVVRSPAIAWSRAATVPASALRCLLRAPGAVTRRMQPGSTTWIDVAQFERLEIEGADRRQTTVVARLAELDLPLARQPAAGTWVLDPTPSVRERLAASAEFELEVRLGGTTESFRFRCIPTRLDLPDGAATLQVAQRQRASLPGSRGWLEVRLDDITMGSVRLELVTAEGSVVAPARLVHARDHVEFALADERYVLEVQRFHTVLIGADHAEFRLVPAAGFRPDRIGQLLQAIAQSDATFLREGKEYGGAAAAQFLVAKLGAQRGQEPSVDDFVDRIASQSSRSGDPYHVRRTDGAVVTMRDWLRDQLRRLDAAAAEPR